MVGVTSLVLVNLLQYCTAKYWPGPTSLGTGATNCLPFGATKERWSPGATPSGTGSMTTGGDTWNTCPGRFPGGTTATSSSSLAPRKETLSPGFATAGTKPSC